MIQRLRAMAMSRDKASLYACTTKGNFQVSKYVMDNKARWKKSLELPRACCDDEQRVEYLMQLKLDKDEETLLATCGNGFVVWFLTSECRAIVLSLPNGVRNISTRMTCSNSVMIDGTKKHAVAGVRLFIAIYVRTCRFRTPHPNIGNSRVPAGKICTCGT